MRILTIVALLVATLNTIATAETTQNAPGVQPIDIAPQSVYANLPEAAWHLSAIGFKYDLIPASICAGGRFAADPAEAVTHLVQTGLQLTNGDQGILAGQGVQLPRQCK